MVETQLQPFSARYKIAEFDVRIGYYDRMVMSPHRADDIREWWTERGLPVVLRADGRHFVPDEDDAVPYEELRIPDYMADPDFQGPGAFLVPDEGHTRTLTGVGGL